MNIRMIGRRGAILAATLVVCACGGGDTGTSATTASPQAAQLPPFNFEIRTLSNRADLVSDGDVLVEVQAPKTVPMDKVKLLLNGVDITATFVADAATRKFRGLVTGLVVGDNQLVADSNGQGKGRPYATLKVTNHPRGGPVLLGSQTTPWICATPTPVAAVGNADPRLPKHASPRQVAGGSIRENVLKCQLKPLDPADYAPATLSDAQLARLRVVFDTGVCDWSVPGVGQQEAISPLTFVAGPGGQPLLGPSF